MNFKGYDYTELFPFLGLGEYRDVDTEMEEFKEALAKVMREEDTMSVSLIRDYVKAMSECGVCCWKPIWLGLLACEDDYTFMQAAYALAEHMWT